MDVHGVDFDFAWSLTKGTFGYYKPHAAAEALESWPVPLFERLLPRHMQIIYAINAEILLEARAIGRFDAQGISRISLIQEDGERRVRMGNLAFVGSHSINGVSALHTDLMKKTVFATSTSSIPTASTTRPTASPSAAGCSRAIRA